MTRVQGQVSGGTNRRLRWMTGGLLRASGQSQQAGSGQGQQAGSGQGQQGKDLGGHHPEEHGKRIYRDRERRARDQVS